jgi:hypothetical protein
MSPMLGYFMAAILIGSGLLLLGAIVRFSILSPIRVRRSKSSLRHPDLAGVTEICGFNLPQELAALYRSAQYVERIEFELVDHSSKPPVVWPIGSFKPVTVPAVRESQAIHPVPGVPIADNLDKGVYYIDREGAIILASPELSNGAVRVASSVHEFGRFVAREIESNESDA